MRQWLRFDPYSVLSHTAVRPQNLKMLNIRIDRLADRLLYLAVLLGMTLVVLSQANAKTLDEAFKEVNASVVEIRTYSVLSHTALG